ncbi:hypothetical protein MXD62_37225 [Frankia sp. Mgl5]|uniref:hypothetical protein n=1 Tax=Frankia sp. Mgl5 TaxID=2933793 RepID=UPI00200F2219|nr:hypothetical protein [Frankia sp. Mgl5]MCK9932718.1 hypothetical protein [Frankia sp. Mgl5]
MIWSAAPSPSMSASETDVQPADPPQAFACSAVPLIVSRPCRDVTDLPLSKPLKDCRGQNRDDCHDARNEAPVDSPSRWPAGRTHRVPPPVDYPGQQYLSRVGSTQVVRGMPTWLGPARVRSPGRAAVAIALGTRAAESFDRPCQGMALAHLAAATGYVRKDHPAPDVAAASAVAALDIIEHAPNAEVHDRARRLATELSAWKSEPLVQELDQRTAAL